MTRSGSAKLQDSGFRSKQDQVFSGHFRALIFCQVRSITSFVQSIFKALIGNLQFFEHKLHYLSWRFSLIFRRISRQNLFYQNIVRFIFWSFFLIQSLNSHPHNMLFNYHPRLVRSEEYSPAEVCSFLERVSIAHELSSTSLPSTFRRMGYVLELCSS